MSQYSFLRCYAIPKSTIKRCRNYSKNNTHLCGVHLNEIKKSKKITFYNGSNVTYLDNCDIKTISPPVKTWQEINHKLYKKHNLCNKLEKQAQLIRTGSYKNICDSLIKTGTFGDEKHVLGFFNSAKHKRLKGETLERAKHFYSVINYFKRNHGQLRKLQIFIRVKIKFKNNMDNIKRIQRWYRHRKWIKSLPVSPSRLCKHYLPQLNKIIMLQRKIKEFIKIKVRYSYRCPYSQEDYWDIPLKHRICYKYKNNNIVFWRYYDIRWLHVDFLKQSESKRFLIEPATKEEFPESFIKKACKQIWILTRKKKDWCIDAKLNSIYMIQKDWNHPFKRRSFYCFNLMLLDLEDLLDCRFDENIMWKSEASKIKHQLFYLQVMPILSNIVSSTNSHYRINDIIYFYTRDILKLENVFASANTTDEFAGTSIYGILQILCETKNTNINGIIVSIVKEHIKTIF